MPLSPIFRGMICGNTLLGVGPFYSSKSSHYLPANFNYILWHCRPIWEFWTGVTRSCQEMLSFPVLLTILGCLLSLVEEEAPHRAQRTLLLLALFYEFKPILLGWKKPEAPSLSYCKGIINKVLPLYKATYLSRGFPQKFEKVWQCLFSATDTLNATVAGSSDVSFSYVD